MKESPFPARHMRKSASKLQDKERRTILSAMPRCRRAQRWRERLCSHSCLIYSTLSKSKRYSSHHKYGLQSGQTAVSEPLFCFQRSKNTQKYRCTFFVSLRCKELQKRCARRELNQTIAVILRYGGVEFLRKEDQYCCNM